MLPGPSHGMAISDRLCRTGRIRPGKFSTQQLGIEHALVDLPASLCVELAEPNGRVRQDPGQIDRSLSAHAESRCHLAR
jgi:hypothetical protein